MLSLCERVYSATSIPDAKAILNPFPVFVDLVHNTDNFGSIAKARESSLVFLKL